MSEATQKREETLIKKYGSAAALAEKRRQWQLKSRKHPNIKKSGFAHMKLYEPERLKEISRKAAQTRHENQQTPQAEDTPKS